MLEKKYLFVLVFGAMTFLSACSSSSKKPDSVAAEGVTFKLDKCTLQPKEFHCDLTMTSNEQDASIEILDSTKITDDLGNEYVLSGGNVANLEIKNGLYTKAQKELTAGEAVAATFIFHDVSIKAKSMKELQIGGRVQLHNQELWKDFQVELEQQETKAVK